MHHTSSDALVVGLLRSTKVLIVCHLLTTAVTFAYSGDHGVTTGISDDSAALNLSSSGDNPGILSFAPATGPVGSTVTIEGSGFSTVPAQNAVKFNGNSAVVITSTTTTLTVEVPSFSGSGPISVTVAGITATSGGVFTVCAAPGVRVSPPSPMICAGTGVTLTASGAVTYEWSPSDGISATTGSIVVVNPAATTSYTLKGYDATGCFAVVVVPVVVPAGGCPPVTRTTATLSAARANLSAAAWGSKALFAGGNTELEEHGLTITTLATVDIYDALADTWSTSALSVPRTYMGAASAGGKIFFAGGTVTKFVQSHVVDIYDVETGTWSTASLSVARSNVTGAAVGNKVLFAGGYPDYNTTVDIYDVSTGQWSTSNLSVGRYNMNAVTANGKVYFAGGHNGSSVNVVDIYDGATGTWSTTTLGTHRSKLAGAAQGNKVIFAGGNGAGGLETDAIDIFDAAGGSTTTTTLSVARGGLAAAATDDYAFFAGGREAGPPSSIVDVYYQGGWTTQVMSVGRTFLTGVAVSGKVMFAGGVARRTNPFGEEVSNVVDIYDSRDDQSITFQALPTDKVYGDAGFSLVASASSTLPVAFSSSNTAVATISGSVVTIVGGGTTVITAKQIGNDSYKSAVATQQLAVAKASQTLSFGALASKTFGDAAFDLEATSSSGLAPSYSSSNQAVATVSGSTLTIVGGGTTTITANEAGNSNYNAASPISHEFTVNKANQSITFDEIGSKIFGNPPFSPAATSSSALPLSFASSNGEVATISNGMIVIAGTGTTTITASQPGNTNYNAATPVQRSITVNKAGQTIFFPALETMGFNPNPFVLIAGTTSGLALSFSSSDVGVVTIEGSTATIIGIGTATITASQAGNSNYHAAVSVEQILTVIKADQSISFSAIADKTFGSAPFELTGSSSSALQLSYSSSNPEVATISGSTVTIVGAGTATITASQAGSENYSPATPVARTLTVNKATQTIAFPEIEPKNFGGPSFQLAATASSGLAVSYQSDKPAVASLAGTAVSLVGAGTVTITASQPGNNNYLAAENVGRTFCVNPAKPVITSSVGSLGFVLASSSQAGNQWYRNDSPLSGEDKNTHVPAMEGVYQVKVTIDGCAGPISDDFEVIITRTADHASEISIYPNPASDKLVISGISDRRTEIIISSAMGQVLARFHSSSSEVVVDLEGYASGVYYIRVITSDVQHTQTFLKH